MAKTVTLSVHKNTIQGRRKREQAKEASARVLSLMRQEDIRAYAFVGIAADGKAYALWDTGGVLPMIAFPDVVRGMLNESIAESGVEEDWRAPMERKS